MESSAVRMCVVSIRTRETDIFYCFSLMLLFIVLKNNQENIINMDNSKLLRWNVDDLRVSSVASYRKYERRSCNLY